MDHDIDERMLGVVAQATARWRARQSVRDARTVALRNGDPLAADSAERVAKRMNRLVKSMRDSARVDDGLARPRARGIINRTTAFSASVLARPDTSAAAQLEAVLGESRDFLSSDFLERGASAARSVGRVLIRTSGGFAALGTAFLVGPGLMITNHHVLPDDRTARRCLLQMNHVLRLNGPAPASHSFELDPADIFMADKDLDYALVRVAALSREGVPLDQYGWLTLDGGSGKILVSDLDLINIVQHPLGREKEVVLRNNRVLDLRTGSDATDGIMGPFIHYEADTEKGSSGSPVFNDSWEVIALHHMGIPATNETGAFLDKDGGVWRDGVDPVERLQWIANEGIRVSALLESIATAGEDVAMRQRVLTALSAQNAEPNGALVRNMLQEGLSAGAMGSLLGARHLPEGQAGRPAAADFKIPLLVSISLANETGTAISRSAQSVTGMSESTMIEERLQPSDFADREGFDRDFLGVEVPLPIIKDSPRHGALLAVPRPAREADRHELRYHHYSVLMNAACRLAYVSACNINFGAAARCARKEGRDRWRADPRIEPYEQVDGSSFDQKAIALVHLTGRDHIAWGTSKADAIVASDDTFFYTNCTPSLKAHDRSSQSLDDPDQLWDDLETHLATQGEAQRLRLSVFNGPLFGVQDSPIVGAHSPVGFFKILIWRDGDDPPAALGFTLTQTKPKMGLKPDDSDNGPLVICQRPIAQIEAELDISFGPVTEWDRFPFAVPVRSSRRTRCSTESYTDGVIMVTRLADIGMV